MTEGWVVGRMEVVGAVRRRCIVLLVRLALATHGERLSVRCASSCWKTVDRREQTICKDVCSQIKDGIGRERRSGGGRIDRNAYHFR